MRGYTAVEPSLHRPLPYLRAAWHLARDFCREGVSLVHCADVQAAHNTALAGRLARRPVLCHVRNRHYAISRRDQIFLWPVHQWAFVSQDTWRRFGYHVPTRRGVVVYDGIDVPANQVGTATRVRRELGIADDAPVVGMVARISPQKDYLTLARAARRLITSYPTTRFLVVGEYESEPGYREHYAQVKRWLEEYQVADHFVFTGFRSDVPRLVAAMDIFVLCTHFEGLPLVLLEGMAQGKPTVATAVDGIPEIVKDGETGLLHDHEDHEGLANQISTLLRDSSESARLGRAGRRSVESFWTNKRFSQDMQHLYEDMLLR